MDRSYAVFGLGEFGRSVCHELMELGADVLAVDRNEAQTTAIADDVTMAVAIDCLNEMAYEKLGLNNMDGVVVSMSGNLGASIMAIMAAKDAGVPLVIAKASDDTQRTIFQKVGANRVVIPERDGAVRAARNLLAKNFLDYIELSDKISIVEINVKREWLNQRLADLNLRSRYGLNVIAVRRDGELLTDIGPDATFIMGDTILVVTDKQDLGLERGK
ncbi:potassium channel family protein [Ligilactobacillus agilis]|uniref:Potassium uptake protein n=4 Tax=Ligilactobacillus agilis TaxID=1601 RepID=A0A0R2AJ24_9LACO|nr:TrkA family potassium uptake protein [Ligilactobacillus agilis]ASR40371.1 potassium transporter TrkA [Ligilactobacillus agilis]KRM63299.1 potassium uptake protein [Ligilactobacillus agilis DSM 20509]MBL1055039.1 TrkA family potassium uptake protein [Ligilactobacillus agilis]MBM6762627.1 TrkA family potassium uptake protein [Ligilactobacillus agilis]MBM6771946.1 TrkA family potassium uptake protein [Ligilactobacillus agilis]